MKEYALYRGDKYIFGGTKKQIAKQRGISVRTLDNYLIPSNVEKALKSNKRYLLIEVEEDENSY